MSNAMIGVAGLALILAGAIGLGAWLANRRRPPGRPSDRFLP